MESINVVSKISEENNILNFTLSGVNVSIANGLRRIVSEIPAVIFRTTPHEANNATFEINTSRMNNELLKQRLSCIPIYAGADFPLADYMLIVDKRLIPPFIEILYKYFHCNFEISTSMIIGYFTC